ncbi:hypothetical protein P5Y53_16175 [Dyella jiangningensis]|uniref:hypothetical protein n=1 Tax=Dyella jiangningensis TaxID=1379159 RepID=UPI00240FD0B5|nr:hypothetical protein [Dyella jiangningensis]MDG2539214.1 hypothetical protein [Dyella jiangningensis]
MTRIILGIGGRVCGSPQDCPVSPCIGVALSEDDIFLSHFRAEQISPDRPTVPLGLGDTAVSDVCPFADHVDGQLVNWLMAHRVAKGSAVLAGWRLTDVGYPQLRYVLPKFAEYLHSDVIELSALSHVLDGVKAYLGSRRDFSGWEKMARTVASYEVLNLTGQPLRDSHANDEALLALLSWRWLRSVVSMPSTEVALAMSGGMEPAGGFDE